MHLTNHLHQSTKEKLQNLNTKTKSRNIVPMKHHNLKDKNMLNEYSFGLKYSSQVNYFNVPHYRTCKHIHMNANINIQTQKHTHIRLEIV